MDVPDSPLMFVPELQPAPNTIASKIKMLFIFFSVKLKFPPRDHGSAQELGRPRPSFLPSPELAELQPPCFSLRSPLRDPFPRCSSKAGAAQLPLILTAAPAKDWATESQF